MADNSGPNSPHLLDKAAVALSGLCLVHCLALPLLMALVPFLSEVMPSHLHAQLLLLVVPVSVLAFALGFRRHGSSAVLAGGALGLGLLALGGTVAHARWGVAADRSLTVAGSLVLAVTHYYNSRLSRHAARRSAHAGHH